MNVMKLEAGKELNELIAVHVMDWIYLFGEGWLMSNGEFIDSLPDFSDDMCAAWIIIEELKDFFYEITVDIDGDWRCFFTTKDDVEVFAIAETAALAICRAALTTAEGFESHVNF